MSKPPVASTSWPGLPAARWGLAVGCVVGLVAAGCGRASSVALAPCRGVVTLDGRPVKGLSIVFHPAEPGPGGPAAVGELDAQGAFTLATSGGRRGAMVGVHRVFFRESADNPLPGVVEPAPAATALPRRYLSAETSELTATIEPGRQNTLEFDLRSETRR